LNIHFTKMLEKLRVSLTLIADKLLKILKLTRVTDPIRIINAVAVDRMDAITKLIKKNKKINNYY
jgi:hypothetical protein